MMPGECGLCDRSHSRKETLTGVCHHARQWLTIGLLDAEQRFIKNLFFRYTPMQFKFRAKNIEKINIVPVDLFFEGAIK